MSIVSVRDYYIKESSIFQLGYFDMGPERYSSRASLVYSTQEKYFDITPCVIGAELDTNAGCQP